MFSALVFPPAGFIKKNNLIVLHGDQQISKA